MKRFLMVAVCLSASAFLHAETECEDTVDMADSLDFHAMHVECAKDPVTLYDPESKSSFLSKNSKVVTAYAEQVNPTSFVNTAALKGSRARLVDQPVGSSNVVEAADNAGMTFNIREPFTLTGGPQSALNGLYVQMAQYCPAGWSKNKEWVEPAQVGYFLHYQFACAGES